MAQDGDGKGEEGLGLEDGRPRWGVVATSLHRSARRVTGEAGSEEAGETGPRFRRPSQTEEQNLCSWGMGVGRHRETS